MRKTIPVTCKVSFDHNDKRLVLIPDEESLKALVGNDQDVQARLSLDVPDREAVLEERERKAAADAEKKEAEGAVAEPAPAEKPAQ